MVEYSELLQISNMIEVQMMSFELSKFGEYPGILIDAVNFIIATKQELSK